MGITPAYTHTGGLRGTGMVQRNNSLILIISILLSRSLPVLSFCRYNYQRTSCALMLAGKGFGKSPLKSYGEQELSPIKDLIDEESCKREFFESNEEYIPLFRYLVKGKSVPATSFIVRDDDDNADNGNNNDAEQMIFEFHETSSPWKRLPATPTEKADISILGDFLDAMQTSLIEDIPVDERTKDDDDDQHFIEEGRRMLVCSRFHVLQGVETGSIDSFERFFSTCWSEITELREKDKADIGSLIVSPDVHYNDLRRFVDINIQRPLNWLGINDLFEVVAFEKGGIGAIRIIYKLSDTVIL